MGALLAGEFPRRSEDRGRPNLPVVPSLASCDGFRPLGRPVLAFDSADGSDPCGVFLFVGCGATQ